MCTSGLCSVKVTLDRREEEDLALELDFRLAEEFDLTMAESWWEGLSSERELPMSVSRSGCSPTTSSVYSLLLTRSKLRDLPSSLTVWRGRAQQRQQEATMLPSQASQVSLWSAAGRHCGARHEDRKLRWPLVNSSRLRSAQAARWPAGRYK